MTLEEHNALIEQVRTSQDGANTSNLLLQLTTDYATVLAENETSKESLEKITKERDDYARANTNLWLQVGQTNSNVNTTLNNATNITDNTDIPTKRTFESLADKF